MSALAFIAGMGTGYFKGKKQKRDEDREDRREQREQDLFDITMEEKRRAKADAEARRAAAADVQVQPIPMEPNADAGPWDAPASPVVNSGYRVGSGPSAREFAAQGAAQAAADAENTPSKRRARVIAAAEKQGDLAGADQMRVTGTQADAAALQMRAAEQAQADAALRKRIDGFKTPDDIAAFITETPADGQNGALKVKAVTSADGKTFKFMKEMPDGSMTPMGQAFGTDKTGIEEAKMTLAGYLSPEQRIAHYKWERERAETERHNRATEAVAQQNANTQEQYRKDQLKLLQAKAKDAGASPYWSKDADEHIVKLNTTKNPETGLEELDGNGAQFMQTVALDLARKNGGNTMAAVARAAEVDAALKVKAKGDPGALAQLRAQALQAASGQAQPAPTPKPAAMAAQGVAMPASAPQQVQAAPVQAAPAQQAPAQQPALRPDQAQALQPYNDAVTKAAQVMAAVARSGDQNAIAMYGQQLQQARAAREQMAVRHLGQQGARQYLATLQF